MPDLHIRRGDKVLGPFSPDEIKQMIADAKINPNDLLRIEGGDQWTRFRDIPNLAKLFRSSSPEYYVKRGTKSLGPLTPNKLRAIVAAGRLQRSDQIRIGPSLTWQPAESVPGLFPAESSDHEWSDLASLESEAEGAADDDLDDEYTPSPPQSRPKSGTASRQKQERTGVATLRILAIVLICIDTALFCFWNDPSLFFRALLATAQSLTFFNSLTGFLGLVIGLVNILAHVALVLAAIGIGMRQEWGRKWAIYSAVALISTFVVVLVPLRFISSIERDIQTEKFLEQLSAEQRDAIRTAMKTWEEDATAEQLAQIAAAKRAAWWATGRSFVIAVAIPMALLFCVGFRSWDD